MGEGWPAPFEAQPHSGVRVSSLLIMTRGVFKVTFCDLKRKPKIPLDKFSEIWFN
jgi:hypothetical protein